MAMYLKGIPVTLYDRQQIGVDGFNRPIYTETPVVVENVLVAPVSSTEALDTLNLTGRRVVYQLGIPKGDTHDWTETEVEFFGKRFRTIGEPTEGIEDMVPLDWNKNVRVEYVR